MSQLFLESIKVVNRDAQNILCHQRRMARTFERFWPDAAVPSLPDVALSQICTTGVCKLRVVYGVSGIVDARCAPYQLRSIRSLRVVDGGNVDYSYKSADRACLDGLASAKNGCDDVIILRDGLVTDTSFSNWAVFDGGAWLTPRRPLLCGTKRELLLAGGVIIEADLSIDDLMRSRCVRLFNAMVEFGEVEVDTSRIFL